MRPYYRDDLVTIYHGSAAEVMDGMNAGSVDFVFTDPPYPKEFDAVWDDLGIGAMHVLRDGGHLLTLLGHYQVPRVIDALRDAGLDYRWLCILPNQNQPIMHGWNVKVCFKPILWFTKGRGAVTPRLMVDNLTARRGSFATAKNAHIWGQPVMAEPILALTDPMDTILDPFAGSGTTLVAAKDMGRRAIGIEMDEAHCEMAANRCRQDVLGLVV